MMTSMITLESISKVYGQQLAVNQVSFKIDKGEICGLVGENGAGKTTLLRILTGLIKSSTGKFVKDKNLRIGALIESPALYPNLSAIANLTYLAKQLGLTDSKQRIAEVLEIVGLSQVDSKKKAKDCSLGMRQRMAIALAILDKPDFLILDEPINGLDPAGIRDMRRIILSLRDQYQMTILLSSHILSELELVVDRYIIMHQGCVLTEFSKSALEDLLDEKIYLAVNYFEKAELLLRNLGLSYEKNQDYLVLSHETDIPNLVRNLVEKGLDIQEIYRKQMAFEDYYLKLIKEGH